jgi:soluble lytic murein transglycosylase-like protein
MKTLKKLFMAGLLAVGIVGGAIWINPPVVTHTELIEVPVKSDERPINDIVREKAKQYGLSEWLLMAVARHESGLANDAIRYEPGQMERARIAAKKLGISRPDEIRMMSSSIGLMQVMAWHAPALGLKSWRDLLDPEINIDAGAQILRACMDKKKSVKGALGCYNGDPDQYPRLVLAELGEMMVEEM